MPPSHELYQWITIAKDVATTVAIFAGAFWFLFRRKLGRRKEVTLACKPLLAFREGSIYVELEVSVKNAGEVEQSLCGFEIAIDGLPDLKAAEVCQSAGIQALSRPLVRERVEEVKASVRPGVTRSLTYLLMLRSPEPLIQVEVQLVYDIQKEPILSTRRLFATNAKAATPTETKGA
jgi:hypothetical protein